jgi:hypothetical protein
MADRSAQRSTGMRAHCPICGRDTVLRAGGKDGPMLSVHNDARPKGQRREYAAGGANVCWASGAPIALVTGPEWRPEWARRLPSNHPSRT